MNDLEQARAVINRIDEQMAALYEERMQAAAAVAQYKINNHLPVFDSAREQEVIQRNVSRLKDPVFAPAYEEFLHFLMDQSKNYQRALISSGKVAYAGVPGAFGHMVSEKLFPQSEKQAKNSFEEVFEAVVSRQAEFGVIPLENNNSGLVGEVMDALERYPVYITRAADQSIDQCLLGLPEATLKDIEWVYSKDQALAQASAFLDSLQVEKVCYPNTAMAAQFVASQQDIHKAAIGARENAALYGLKVLASRIEANDSNTTRFLVIARNPNEKMEDHFSLIATVPNTVGSLSRVIEVLTRHNMNMDGIQSRPLKGRPFEYFFYIQCFGTPDEESVKNCLQDLKEVTTSIKWLGSYAIQKERNHEFY